MIMNHFNKQAHLTYVRKNIKANQMVTTSMSNIFKYYGLPASILHDYYPWMTSLHESSLGKYTYLLLVFFLSLYHEDGQSPKCKF